MLKVKEKNYQSFYKKYIIKKNIILIKKMRLLDLTIFLSIFINISAFPNVGTSTGVMRQKIMLRRAAHRYRKRKDPKIPRIGWEMRMKIFNTKAKKIIGRRRISIKIEFDFSLNSNSFFTSVP